MTVFRVVSLDEPNELTTFDSDWNTYRTTRLSPEGDRARLDVFLDWRRSGLGDLLVAVVYRLLSPGS